MTDDMKDPGTGPEQDAGKNSVPKNGTKKTMFSEDTLNLFRILICFALIAPVFQLYFTIPAAISMWVAEQYVPFVNMLYFTAIILIGLWLLRYSFTFSGTAKEKK